jgi:hypothetical protein
LVVLNSKSEEAETMKSLRTASVILCFAVLAMAFGSTAKASERDKKTIFTFSSPVELPGISLPAGTYVFKLMDSLADRNIVQVFDKDEMHLYATFLTIPDYRPKVSDKTIVRFSETAPGAPPALKVWFYPGESTGWEFVYPKSRAVELAKASKQAVPSMPSEMVSEITKPAKSSKDASVKAMSQAPLKAQQGNGNETELGDSFSAKAPN